MGLDSPLRRLDEFRIAPLCPEEQLPGPHHFKVVRGQQFRLGENLLGLPKLCGDCRIVLPADDAFPINTIQQSLGEP